MRARRLDFIGKFWYNRIVKNNYEKSRKNYLIKICPCARFWNVWARMFKRALLKFIYYERRTPNVLSYSTYVPFSHVNRVGLLELIPLYY